MRETGGLRRHWENKGMTGNQTQEKTQRITIKVQKIFGSQEMLPSVVAEVLRCLTPVSAKLKREC